MSDMSLLQFSSHSFPIPSQNSVGVCLSLKNNRFYALSKIQETNQSYHLNINNRFQMKVKEKKKNTVLEIIIYVL